MKILMATMGLDIGGAETHIVELSKELQREGHEVLIASNGGVYVPEIEAAGIKHFSVPMHRRSIKLIISSLIKMYRIIKAEKPQVVHAHARIPGFICGALKKLLKFPFVTTAHWVFDTGGALKFLTNWGDKTVSVSEDISDYLTENYGIPKKDIFVTINGIDTEKFSPEISGDKVREEFSIPLDAPLISHVSRMDESRALAARFLIDTAEDIAERVPGAVILIVGGGDVFDELCLRAAEANRKIGYRCVIMAGPRTDINEFAAAGDIFVGVSRAALEAMAAAKPTVIAGNEGYMGTFTPEKLEVGIEGNFCCRGCGDIERDLFLHDVTSCLLLSDEEKKNLGEYGRNIVLEHYSVGKMAQDTMEAYSAAIPAKRVVMSGYYGFGNAGDEAILKAIYEMIKRIDPGVRVTVLSNDPKLTAETYGCESAARFGPIALHKAVVGCDVFISGGGSLLQDATSTRSLLYYLFLIRMAQLRKKKVVLLANGIGPINKPFNRRIVKSAVEKADVVTLRDPESLEELRSLGITREDMIVTADPVFLLEEPETERAEDILRGAGIVEEKFVAVSPRPWGDNEENAGKLARICDGVIDEYGVKVALVAMQSQRDEAVCRAICEKMRGSAHVISGAYSARELMGVIEKSELVLSMRLHSIIFAARAATPAIGFVYDPKVEAYLSMLSLPSAGKLEETDEEAVIKAVGVMLSHRSEFADKLKVRRDEMVELASKNEDVIKEILK